MFEFQIAFKYLLPRTKSLSTALISLMSVLVISLVIWLVLVFLSVTSGIEKNWLKNLTALHAPIRVSPTQEYYASYYYKIDSLSSDSKYTLKTIGEKVRSLSTDPYSESVDAELPLNFPKKEGLDPVKIAYQQLKELGLPFQDYEISGALLRINRGGGAVLSQMSYLLSEPTKNPNFESLIIESMDYIGNDVPISLPKNYKNNGVKIGDRGTLGYTSPSTLSNQEHRIPIVVKAFYDPGLVSMGNKCVIVPSSITQTVHAASQTFSPDGTPTNGFFIWLDDLDSAEKFKNKITKEFEKSGISKYWQVDTYRDFEFSKDLLQQFQSDRILFLLIASIILIVACCNIISLLVLLVNEKKKEIAILQTMGANFKSIALIFGFCGAFIGFISCVLGSFFAIFTLEHLDSVVSILSNLQGHNAFNPAFFGNTLPNELSTQGLAFVLIITPILSILAGLIPAMKASRIRSSDVLRSE